MEMLRVRDGLDIRRKVDEERQAPLLPLLRQVGEDSSMNADLIQCRTCYYADRGVCTHPGPVIGSRGCIDYVRWEGRRMQTPTGPTYCPYMAQYVVCDDDCAHCSKEGEE